MVIVLCFSWVVLISEGRFIDLFFIYQMFLFLAPRHIQNKNFLWFNCVLLRLIHSLKQSSHNCTSPGISYSFDATSK